MLYNVIVYIEELYSFSDLRKDREIMEKIRVQVNGRGYFLKTDHPQEVEKFAKEFSEQIAYVGKKLGVASEAEATAYSALMILGDSLTKPRSEADQALIDELNGRTEVLEERIDELSRQIAEHNDTEAAARNEIQGLRQREAELVDRIGKASEQFKQLAGEKEDVGNSLSDAKNALASANKIIAQLNSEKFTEVAANEALRSETDNLREKLESANKQIAELNGKLTNMEINSISVASDGSVAADAEEIKKLRAQKEDLEIDLAIANEEIAKLRNGEGSETAKKLAEYEKMVKQYESRTSEIDKLRSLLAETEASVRSKLEQQEEENDKLRNILSNYESSYALSIAKKEEEILELQQRVERLKTILNLRSDEKIGGKYVQTTFDTEEGSDTGNSQ